MERLTRFHGIARFCLFWVLFVPFYTLAVELPIRLLTIPTTLGWKWMGVRYRCAHSQMHMWSGDRTFRLFAFVMGMRVRLDLPDPDEMRGGPIILVSNHRHILDIILLLSMCRRLGFDQVRWVVKRSIRTGSLALGHSMAACGFAFIGRDHDPRDVDAVKRMGTEAYADWGNAAIFPEGTRTRRPDSPFLHLNQAKEGGFLELIRHMPGCQVLDMTLVWQTHLPERGHTILDGACFLGANLLVRGELVGPFQTEDEARLWLRQAWEEKDRFLGGEARRLAA